MVSNPRVTTVLLVSVLLGCNGSKPQAKSEPQPATNAKDPSGPPGSVTGTVLANGVARAGVEVCARQQGADHTLTHERAEPTCTATDDAGGFTLALAPGVWSLVASAVDHQSDSHELEVRAGISSAAVDMWLQPGGRTFSGLVVDLDGKPIVGVSVSAQHFDGVTNDIVARTESDEVGHFQLTAHPHVLLNFSAPGFTGVVRDGDEYVLMPESVITGQVVGADGRGVAGVRVVTSFGDTATTDASGHYRLGQLAAGEYRLVAVSDEQIGSVNQQAVGFAETLADVTITLDTPVHRLRARVVERNGEPVTECRLAVKADLRDMNPPEFLWIDEKGMIDAPAMGTQYDIQGLHCAGLRGMPPYETIRLGDANTEVPTITVDRGGVVRGRILDANGQPRRGVSVMQRTVEIRPSPGPRFVNVNDIRESDADGRFELSGLEPGVHELRVRGWPRIGPAPMFTITGRETTEIETTLPATGRIEVKTSAACAGQQVQVFDCEVGHFGPGGGPWSVDVETDEHGRAILEPVAVGRHRVGIGETASCRAATGLEVTVEPDRTASVELECQVVEAPQVVVRVLNSDGTPAARALVYLGQTETAAPSRAQWAGYEALAISDGEGRLTIPMPHDDPDDDDDDGPWGVFAVRPGEFAGGLIKVGASELTLRLEPTAQTGDPG